MQITQRKNLQKIKIVILYLCIVLSPSVLAQPSTLNNGNDPGWSDLYCNQPGTIRNGSIPCIEPKCSSDQVKKNGKCMSPSSTGGNNNGSTDGSTKSSGKNAEKCIVIGYKQATHGSTATQTITNTCNEKIGIIFCHSPSSLPGTLTTECNYNNRYYQQFSTMEPGQIKDNFYSMPVDATIHFGACFGGESKIKQTSNGEYICR